MSRENVELVRAAFEEIGRLMVASTVDPHRSLKAEYARLDRFFDPHFELVPAASAVERRTLRGSEGLVTFMEGGRETWRDVSLEAEEFIDLGDRVLAVGTFRASGRASGAAIEQPNGTVGSCATDASPACRSSWTRVKHARPWTFRVSRARTS